MCSTIYLDKYKVCHLNPRPIRAEKGVSTACSRPCDFSFGSFFR
jgi:hypothetical protein